MGHQGLSDLVLIPVRPSPIDVWATDDIVSIVKERRLVTDGFPKCSFLLCCVVKNTVLSESTKQTLDVLEIPLLESYTTQRQAYMQCLDKGKNIYSDLKNRNSANEVDSIINEILEKYL